MPSSHLKYALKIIWNGPVKKEYRKTIRLKNTKEFRIAEANSTTPLIKLDKINKRSAIEQTFDVVFSPGAKAGGYSEKLTLKLDTGENTEEEQLVEIDVVAILK